VNGATPDTYIRLTNGVLTLLSDECCRVSRPSRAKKMARSDHKMPPNLASEGSSNLR
jgi:hypothetical protein